MNRRRSSALLVACAASLALAALPSLGAGQEGGGGAPAPQAGGGEADGMQRFAGTWRLAVSPARGTQTIETAIGQCVAPMNFIVRPIAAGRLRGKNALVRRIQMSFPNGHIRIVFDGSRTYDTPNNTWGTTRGPDGAQLRIQHRYRNGAIVQLFRSGSGTRRNVYRLQGSNRMRYEVTVTSSSLPRNMRYRLSYRR